MSRLTYWKFCWRLDIKILSIEYFDSVRGSDALNTSERIEGFEVRQEKADIVIIGGGTAGCMAAVTIKEKRRDCEVLVVEKAHIDRSGCLAAGVNAINAYLNPGQTPEDFLEYVKNDSAGLVREDLVLSIAQGLNQVTEKVERWGLPIYKDEAGNYLPRGKRSIKINGEPLKPILAQAVKKSGARVLNRVNCTDYIVKNGRVAGVFAFSTREKIFYVIQAKAVICATGGAAGLYRPNNPGQAKHKMWYSPFNTGAGYAMGIRAGAEMTTLEMRFIALRIKDTIAPTGTLAQGFGAKQINSKGEEYLQKYGANSTSMRLYATLQENMAGRGPCFLDTTSLTDKESNAVKKAYLNMCPSMVLWWKDSGLEPNQRPVEIMGSEPYIVGGHTQSGYWIDSERRTTLTGLWAAGDVAGGAPKKYVTGCWVEGEIAAKSALKYIESKSIDEVPQEMVEQEFEKVTRFFRGGQLDYGDLEEGLQKIMDEYAGGLSSNYLLNEEKLMIAREQLIEFEPLLSKMRAGDMFQLTRVHEVIDRHWVARALVEHLLYRKETRWPCYQSRLDYPAQNDDRWLVFVNSIYNGKKNLFEIIERQPKEVVSHDSSYRPE